ncbi:hypothetical protein F5Y15DRAFT_158597 [Xylariaceae sp. FL0016]|nr:hypothetical protein F5Y15DRAFT_158597 [Xylariaceae sp. FL0016]
MFGTLRNDVTTNGPGLLLEATNAPFSKQRQGTLTKNACAQCRLRKSKCTGEAEGCHRCRERRLQCRYPMTRGVKPGRNTKDLISSPPSSLEENQIVSSSSREDEGATTVIERSGSVVEEADASGHNAWSLGSNPSSNDRFDFGTSFEFAESDVMVAHGASTGLFDDFVPQLISPDASQKGPDRNDSHHHINHGAKAAANTSNGSPDNFHTFHSQYQCSCFAQAISVHENIEVNLVGVLHDHSGTAEELLKQQKNCLAECENLLECNPCCSRSDYVMLILSMCMKIASSLENSWLALPLVKRGTSGNSESRQITSPAETSECNQLLAGLGHILYTRNSYHIAQQKGIRGSDGNTATRGLRSEQPNGSQRLEIGAWELDDEDEIHVFRSLLLARVQRFGSLAHNLERMVAVNDWPVHKGVVLDLKANFAEILDTVENLFKTK